MINHHNGSYIVFDNKYGKAWKDKCPGKVMVWIAISNCGISKPLFCPSKSEAVDSDMYIIVYKASFHSWASHRLKLYFLAWFSWLYSKQTVAWMDERPTLCLNVSIHKMSSRHVRLGIYEAVWHKKFTRKNGMLIRSSSK